MLITNVLVTGTVAYAGVKTLVTYHRQAGAHRRGETQPYEINTPPKASSKVASESASEAKVIAAPVDSLALGAPSLHERRQRAAAATAVWLSLGGLLWSPLALVGVPLTIYSSVSVLEAAGWSLYAEGRLRPSVINSILLVSTLVTEHYLPAAVISWLHHSFKQIGQRVQTTGEQVATEMDNELGDLLRQAMGGSPRMVWVIRETDGEQNIEMKIPFADLKTGDILVANRGEFIPVNGVVTSGEATINLLLVTRSGEPMTVHPGEHVYKGAFVTEGRIRIQIDQIQ